MHRMKRLFAVFDIEADRFTTPRTSVIGSVTDCVSQIYSIAEEARVGATDSGAGAQQATTTMKAIENRGAKLEQVLPARAQC
jgi:hypothetical protein